MTASIITPALEQVGIFKDLTAEERRSMEVELETRALKRGEVLVRQGEPADALYIVVSGRFEVHIAGNDGPIAEIGVGSPVGEMAFLAGGARTATVIAARDSLVLRLGKVEFERLCQRSSGIWRTMTVTLASRLADTNAGRRPPTVPVPRTIALIPAGPKPLAKRFVELIAEAFRAEGPMRVVNSSDLSDIIGRGTDLASDKATERLNALEGPNETVLFVADKDLTSWSQKAIRQADLVLRVGSADTLTEADVPLNGHEKFAASLVNFRAQRLVLLHPRRRAPRGTRHWLAGRDVQMHHHVALVDRVDVDRLVRFIKGKALGLVACGGGAFCASHVGLYKAFLEAGLSFDIMGGTSGGSCMAAAFAMGLDPDAIDRATHDIFVTNRALRRYTWPRYSILDHTHFDRLLAEHYAGIDIEDLWIPFFAISTNLSRYSLHQHRTGSLWSALRASGSIPALLPPFYTEDGQMLVDGCLLDNVPVRSMHEIKTGPNIVVAFEVPALQRFEVDYKKLPSRGDLLRHYFNPFTRKSMPKAPSLGSVLLRSLMANRQDFERHLTVDDLLLVPPLPENMSILDWGRHSELMATSHAWAGPELARLVLSQPAALGRIEPGRAAAIPRVTASGGSAMEAPGEKGSPTRDQS